MPELPELKNTQFAKFILKDCQQTRRREQKIARKELRSKDAVVKSRLSNNLVKFEQDIKVSLNDNFRSL